MAVQCKIKPVGDSAADHVVLVCVLGALVNAARRHQTALHMAAVKENDAMARLLVDFGADVYIENKGGLRPSALVPDHRPLYHFLRHCESTHHNLICSVDYCFCFLCHHTVE